MFLRVHQIIKLLPDKCKLIIQARKDNKKLMKREQRTVTREGRGGGEFPKWSEVSEIGHRNLRRGKAKEILKKRDFLKGGKKSYSFISIFIWITDELEFISRNWHRPSIFSLFKAKLSRSSLRFKLWRLKEGPCKNLDYEHWTIFMHGLALFGNLEIFWLYIFILFQIFENIIKCIYSSLSI